VPTRFFNDPPRHAVAPSPLKGVPSHSYAASPAPYDSPSARGPLSVADSDMNTKTIRGPMTVRLLSPTASRGLTSPPCRNQSFGWGNHGSAGMMSPSPATQQQHRYQQRWQPTQQLQHHRQSQQQRPQQQSQQQQSQHQQSQQHAPQQVMPHSHARSLSTHNDGQHINFAEWLPYFAHQAKCVDTIESARNLLRKFDRLYNHYRESGGHYLAEAKGVRAQLSDLCVKFSRPGTSSSSSQSANKRDNNAYLMNQLINGMARFEMEKVIFTELPFGVVIKPCYPDLLIHPCWANQMCTAITNASATDLDTMWSQTQTLNAFIHPSGRERFDQAIASAIRKRQPLLCLNVPLLNRTTGQHVPCTLNIKCSYSTDGTLLLVAMFFTNPSRLCVTPGLKSSSPSSSSLASSQSQSQSPPQQRSSASDSRPSSVSSGSSSFSLTDILADEYAV
jgi:hypothetical protein